MKNTIKGLLIIIVALALVAVIVILVASTPEGLEKLQGVVDDITGEKVDIDLTEFGIWSKKVREDTLDKLPSGEAFYAVKDDTMVFDQEYPVYTEDVSLDFKAKKVKNICIMVGACTLEQSESADRTIHVSSEEVGKFQCFLKDNTLYILGEQKIEQGLAAKPFKNTITVSIPKNKSFHDISVNLGAGKVDLADMKAENASFEVGAGYLKVATIDANKAQIKVGMGKADIDQADVGEMAADIDIGDLKYQGTISQSATFQCAVGNIYTKLAGKPEDFDYTLECSVGNISISGTDYTAISTKKTIDNLAERKMELSCSMGNIKIDYE